jgi:hypothetical protein
VISDGRSGSYVGFSSSASVSLAHSSSLQIMRLSCFIVRGWCSGPRNTDAMQPEHPSVRFKNNEMSTINYGAHGSVVG